MAINQCTAGHTEYTSSKESLHTVTVDAILCIWNRDDARDCCRSLLRPLAPKHEFLSLLHQCAWCTPKHDAAVSTLAPGDPKSLSDGGAGGGVPQITARKRGEQKQGEPVPLADAPARQVVWNASAQEAASKRDLVGRKLVVDHTEEDTGAARREHAAVTSPRVTAEPSEKTTRPPRPCGEHWRCRDHHWCLHRRGSRSRLYRQGG
mmetsp:Transcript_20928/g.48356  ORF Transcript_20928/g.48356 Transcript_20928/m.48356 type:complete len:206 (-) Transcript_20928:332-949(-)